MYVLLLAFSLFLVSLFFFIVSIDLMGLWSLRWAHSKFKLHPLILLLLLFWGNILLSANWLKGFNFKFHVFILKTSSFVSDVDLKLSLSMGWNSIHETHENSRWNKVHPRNIIYNLISCMKCNHHVWIQMAKLNWHLLNLLSITPIFFTKEYVKGVINQY